MAEMDTILVEDLTEGHKGSKIEWSERSFGVTSQMVFGQSRQSQASDSYIMVRALGGYEKDEVAIRKGATVTILEYAHKRDEYARGSLVILPDRHGPNTEVWFRDYTEWVRFYPEGDVAPKYTADDIGGAYRERILYVTDPDQAEEVLFEDRKTGIYAGAVLEEWPTDEMDRQLLRWYALEDSDIAGQNGTGCFWNWDWHTDNWVFRYEKNGTGTWRMGYEGSSEPMDGPWKVRPICDLPKAVD